MCWKGEKCMWHLRLIKTKSDYSVDFQWQFLRLSTLVITIVSHEEKALFLLYLLINCKIICQISVLLNKTPIFKYVHQSNLIYISLWSMNKWANETHSLK